VSSWLTRSYPSWWTRCAGVGQALDAVEVGHVVVVGGLGGLGDGQLRRVGDAGHHHRRRVRRGGPGPQLGTDRAGRPLSRRSAAGSRWQPGRPGRNLDRAAPSRPDDGRGSGPLTGPRVRVRRPYVDEVDAHPVDVGRELRQRVQPRLTTAPVVLGRPSSGRAPGSSPAHALRPVGDECAAEGHLRPLPEREPRTGGARLRA
jgi:hypothetical protein